MHIGLNKTLTSFFFIHIFAGERPYKCHLPECGRAFIQLSNLQQHLRNHDAQVERAKNRPFHCNICGKGFATESSLRTHTSKVSHVCIIKSFFFFVPDYYYHHSDSHIQRCCQLTYVYLFNSLWYWTINAKYHVVPFWTSWVQFSVQWKRNMVQNIVVRNLH